MLGSLYEKIVNGRSVVRGAHLDLLLVAAGAVASRRPCSLPALSYLQLFVVSACLPHRKICYDVYSLESPSNRLQTQVLCYNCKSILPNSYRSTCHNYSL
ncbi:hypothetical protein RB195_005941 [Necator americanus]|uniref:Uncharacterized protein n=1 Tax=Necator americanus TaxID=51031 RepID=A0ABR1BQB2_NECAM